MAGGRVVVGWLVSKVGRAAPWKGRDWSSDWLGAGVQVDIHLSGGPSLGRTDRQQELACWASEGVAGASEWGGGGGRRRQWLRGLGPWHGGSAGHTRALSFMLSGMGAMLGSRLQSDKT